MHVSRKISRFTPEQIQLLAANPFTFKVEPRHIWFTLEFKNLFLARYEAGETSMEIFESCGYDSAILGIHRIYNYPRHLRTQLASGVPLTEGPANRRLAAPSDVDYNTMPAQQSVAAMQREITYLRQQIDFLKKISEQANNARRGN